MRKLFSVVSGTLILSLFGFVYAFSLPSQVEGVQVVKSGDTSVRISWREAESAEDIIIGYKVYFGTTSVQEAGETYDDEVVVYGGVETNIDNLQPGTTYYFAVTALDSEENESENYSAEVEFLFPIDETVVTPPVKQPPKTEEKPKIACQLLPEKFITCEAYTCEFVHPMTAQKMSRTIEGIEEGKCHFVETMPNDQRLDCQFPAELQITMAQYYQKIIGGQETEDVLQTAMDNGQCFVLEKGDLVPLTEDTSTPTEKVVVPKKTIDGSFGPEKPDEFKSAAPDTTPPLEAMNLSVDTERIDSDGVAVLSWKKSLDLENDLADQIVYVREGMGSWDSGYSIGKDIETLELDVEKGQTYEFKVVSVDTVGNRAESQTFSFSTKLPQSGPAGVIGVFVALFILGTLGLISARRRA